MEKKQDEKSFSKSTLFVIIITVFLAVFVFQQRIRVGIGGNNSFQRFFPEPSKSNASGEMSFITDKGRYKTGKPFTIQIIGNSIGRAIVGYDMILEFDSSSLEIAQIASAHEDFQIFTYKNPGQEIITGTKYPSSSTKTFFEGEILTLTVIPQKKGILTLSLVSERGKEKTQWVDGETNIIYPRVGYITLDIY